MSLHPHQIEPVPQRTALVARAAFPHGNPYLTLRDKWGTLFDDAQFAHLFPKRGKPAFAPWRLALITLLQFAEGLSDRRAAEAVRSRIDWKYLLSLELEDSGFDASVLCEFRGRLLEGGAEGQLFETLLSLCKEQKLLKARGRQRTDSTHILAAVRALSRIELVTETLRHALDLLATVAPDFLVNLMDKQVPQEQRKDWIQRYSHRAEYNRIPIKEEEQQHFVKEVGSDGSSLLSAVYASDAPIWLREVPAIDVLRRVWVQNYYQSDEGISFRDTPDIPRSRYLISSPLDTDARLSKKGSTCWVGYKIHLTETCDEELPPLITHVETASAPVADGEATPKIHQALAAKDLLPQTHIVDTGFLDAELMVTSKRDFGVEMYGPTRPKWRWKAREGQGFGLEQFQLDWEKEQAVCPEGHTSIEWTPRIDVRGNDSVYIRFASKDCEACPSRSLCFPSEKQPARRSISIRPKEQFLALQAARLREGTKEYAREYARRAGIEGTLSRCVRRCRVRRSRYLSFAKVHLGNLLAATAVNFLRVGEWLSGIPIAATRRSPFARLMASLSTA